MSLVQQFSAYSEWRACLASRLGRLRSWMEENDLLDVGPQAQLERLQQQLNADRLAVAFVAEFSRGKSELINAIFFADCGGRVLPSSAGRTTMCPTELLFDPAKPPGIELLPIDTRASHMTLSEYRAHPREWRSFPLDTGSASAMQVALSRVGEQRPVRREEALRMGFAVDPAGESGLRPDSHGMVHVPRWRHAVINFPHPLLQQGLVILDTPGLNAIGMEPELTLSLLPGAQAIVFILAADTGVTRTDLAVWHNYIVANGDDAQARIVVLNKIDGLWDGLRTQAEIDVEIGRQIDECARTLGVNRDRVFAVSAQKALLAKVHPDAQLLERSRISRLEEVLSLELLPAKRRLVTQDARHDAGIIVRGVRELLQARHAGAAEQLAELTRLRGKNRGVLEYLARRTVSDQQEFDLALRQYQAVRSVFSNLSNRLFRRLGPDAVREETRRTREAMLSATFSLGLRSAMSGYFQALREALRASSGEIDEIFQMLRAMYRRFAVEHGLKLGEPAPFSTARYEKEIARLETAFNHHLNTVFRILTMEKRALTEKFFETVVIQARRIFSIANRDAEAWLRGVMAPIEAQVREHQHQLRRRLENVRRIEVAAGTLEDRIGELNGTLCGLDRQIAQLDGIEAELRAALEPAAQAAA